MSVQVTKLFFFAVPAVVDVEVGGHDGSREQSGMSPCDSINHGGYRPPVDVSGSTQEVYQCIGFIHFL